MTDTRRAFTPAEPEPRVTTGGVVAVILMSPLFLLGYAFASLFLVVPIYIALAIFGDTYTILPDTQHELQTAGAILAVLTGLFFLQGIAKAAAPAGTSRSAR